MDIEAGDYIYCHTTGRMNQSGEVFAYRGESYEVTQSKNNKIWFIDAMGSSHTWRMDTDIDNFNDYFSIPKPLEPKKGITEHKFI